ncbi:MAG TPA: hypothetical protein VF400_05510 [Anaeromyxobacteraceae bacterium]
MQASAPSSLDSAALARRLGELAGHERAVQVEFLLHLDEFDTRRAWAEEGYGSLWDYLLRVLHLSTVTVLGPLFAEENVGELVTRAAYLTKAEVERVVATLQPRTAPKDGLRRLPSKKAQPPETRPPVDEPSTLAVSVATAPSTPAALQVAPRPRAPPSSR